MIRVAVVSLVLVCGITFYVTNRDFWDTTIRNLDFDSSSIYENESTRSRAYLIMENDWLEFPISMQADSIRLLTNAILPKDATLDPAMYDRRPGWKYSITYRLRDQDNRLIDEGIYHFRVQLAQYEDAQGQLTNATFLSDPNFVPSQSQTLKRRIPSDVSGPFRWQLRLVDRLPNVPKVCVRVYAREPRPNHQRPFSWQRLSFERREQICRGSVYDYDLMTTSERSHLLRWKWLAVAPHLGSGSMSYESKLFIYTRDEETELEESIINAPLGTPLGPNRLVSFPIPPFSSNVSLRFQRQFDQPHTRTKDAEITISLFGSDTSEFRTITTTMAKETKSVPIDMQEGLLVIQADQELVVRLMGKSINDPTSDTASKKPTSRGSIKTADITPEPRFLRTYLLDADTQIDYSVMHVNSMATPFCLALRRIPDPRQSPDQTTGNACVTVNCQIMGKTGEILHDAPINVEEPWSMYDRVVSMVGSELVSDAKKTYFNLSNQVGSIRVSSTEPILVCAYTRLPDLPRITRLPLDYAPHIRYATGSRSWFLIRPHQRKRLFEDGKTRSLRIQPRPPAISPEVLSGQYSWESLTAVGSQSAKPLLTPVLGQLPNRERTKSALFFEVPTDKVVSFQSDRPTSHRWIPRIIYRREQSDADTFRLFVNGKKVLEKKLRARQGEIQLHHWPDLEKQTMHTLRIVSNGKMRLFINGIANPSLPVFRKRLALQANEPLIFDYLKATDEKETLTLHYYSATSDASTSVRIRIEIPRMPLDSPTSAQTLSKQIFEFNDDEPKASMVLFSLGQKVSKAQQCFLTLDKDLHPGHYKIVVEQLSGEPGYFLLSKTTPGISDSYQIWLETDLKENYDP